MRIAELPPNEAHRLAVLNDCLILDTNADEAWDNLTDMLAQACEAPIALISLVDEHRQWFKSRVGLGVSETSRDVAFCSHAILGSDLFEVRDAEQDERFAQNPLVQGEPNIRFYAGAPLEIEDGVRIGTVCVIDHVPRELNRSQRRLLELVRDQVVLHLQMERLLRQQTTQRLTATALTRVGLELITGLGAPNLLDRLCKVTAEVMQSDFSHTIRWNSEDDTYRVIAGWEGEPTRLSEALGIAVRSDQVPDEMKAIQLHELLEIDASRKETRSTQLLAELGIARVLMIGLRRGDEIYGVQVAGYRSPGKAFTQAQRAVFEGIGQVGALALEASSRAEDLDKATRIKTYFASTLSHELRGTFAIIHGIAEMLADDAGTMSADQLELVRTLRARAAEGLDIVGVTLQLFQSEAVAEGSNRVFEPVDQILHQLSIDLQPPSRHSDVELIWSLAPGTAGLRLPAPELKAIVRNLVDNAFKFTKHGRITVATRVVDDKLELSVCDTGVGIAQDAIARLFDPFSQAHGASSVNAGGSGLGLYIVHRLVTLLRGSVTVESKLGEGTCFRITLPG